MTMILVTGATGYIAGRLIPQLLERGYKVRVLARTPHRLSVRSWSSRVEIVSGDVLDSASLASAMQGIHTAYYLVHNMTSGHGYTKIEIQAAQNFARAAEAAGVKHILYLGGLADPEQHIAPHMRSRIETGVALREGSVPVTEFRAGVIAGSGSISFEMIRFLTELFPVIPGPVWLKNKAQPIAAQNVIDYLLAALDNWDGQGRVFEIGGPKVATYQNLMESYARASGLKRRLILFPYIPIELMAFVIGLTTPVPLRIARALVGGLSRDSMVLHQNVHDVYPINLIDFDTVIQEALENLHPHKIDRVWHGDQRNLNPFKHEGFLIDRRTLEIKNSREQMLERLHNFGIKDFVVESRSDAGVLFCSTRTRFGKHWVEYSVEQSAGSPGIAQTSYFAPHGLAGFLYGYGLWLFCHNLLARLNRHVQK
jgi:uncharacterized protein YbjT (DUF2867 family)